MDENPSEENLFDLGACLLRLGRLRQQSGDMDGARSAFEEAADVVDKGKKPREKAVVLGSLADIHQARCELDEALRIRKQARGASGL